jgi:hypothetical protein
MTPRRSRYAPTDESRIPHWLVTYDLLRRAVSTEHLAIGTDLCAAMRAAIEECEADGWTVENDGAYDFIFLQLRRRAEIDSNAANRIG